MIKPEELRIGSTVWLKSKNKPYTIACGYDIDEGIDSDDFEPIELTETWLFKLGFEKHIRKYNTISNTVYYIDDFEIQIHGDIFPLSINGGEAMPYLTQYFAHHTKSVNQLQNLYFALTGSELTIKNS